MSDNPLGHTTSEEYMIRFILNDKEVGTTLKPGTTLLDFIRYHEHLTGTKIGCREGDCGACTVLEGRLTGGRIEYRTIVSCLTPLGNAAGKHIVTVEGISGDSLNPAQQAMVDHNGTQCGFCTPGFVVSLTCHSMQNSPSAPQKAIDAVSGNICRCTGYQSIRQAAITLSDVLKEKDPDNPIGWLVSQAYLPPWFVGIPERLSAMNDQSAAIPSSGTMIGGGTDLMVQKPDDMAEAEPVLLFDREDLKGVNRKDDRCVIGAAATATDIMHSPVMRLNFPRLEEYFFLVSSKPIRNMGTLGGNICNASPIADLVIFFLALNSELLLADNKTGEKKTVPLEDFFQGYKQLNKKDHEIVASLSFPLPGKNTAFNFEKVSKRNTLDIASVNGAMMIRTEEGVIREARVSAGGVAPIPLFLRETSRFLTGRPLNARTLREASKILDQEITPISDIRGSKNYKRLLARQLFYAHFLKLFPDLFRLKDLTDQMPDE